MWSALPWEAWFTLAVLVTMLVLLVKEAASPDLILLGSLAALLVAGVFENTADAFVGFSSGSVLTIGSLFVVAAGSRKTEAFAVLNRLIRPRSANLRAALARLMLPVSAVSAFVNNTPLVAILVAPVESWASRVGIPPSKLLIPLSYATVLGGMSTLIGTSTNLVVSDFLVANGSAGFSMFELAWVGVPAAIIGYLYFATVGHRLLPDRGDQARIARDDPRSYQFELRVAAGSALVGKSVEEAGLRHLVGAFLAHVSRRREVIAPVRPALVLEAGDLLAFSGSPDIMDTLLAVEGLERPDGPLSGAPESPALRLFEAVVSAKSSLVGKTLQRSRFRERFQATVLGIHRAGARVDGPLGRSAIHGGDLLLVESLDDFTARWIDSDEFYLVAPIRRRDVVPSRRAPWVFAIFSTMVVAIAAGWLPVANAALAAAILVVFVAGLSPTEARQALDLSVLLVLAASFGIGAAISQTGLAGCIGTALVDGLAPLGPIGVLAGVYVATNLLTEILTNNVAAVIVFPIGLAAAQASDLDLRGVAVVIAIAASAGFATPIGYQTNLMVMGPGGYRFADFFKVGVPLNLLVFALTMVVVRWVWY